ncbi:hypothetical protein OQA88_5031 [Cercophora sp. LCS_1]
MAPTLSKSHLLRLADLKVSTLKTIGLRCGLPVAGRKQDIVESITTALISHKPPPPSTRILSIDLGIRNFAFSLLTPPPSLPSIPTSPSLKETPEPPGPTLGTLHKWQRLSLLPSSSSKNHDRNGKKQQDFAPSTLATLTLSLIDNYLLPLSPTHILIERQRHRTAGRSEIQEWTIRVNTLEAMLYSVFATLQHLKLWNGEIVPIPPARVANFAIGSEAVAMGSLVEGREWGVKGLLDGKVGDGGEEGGNGIGYKGVEGKRRKVAIVREILARPGRLEIGNEEVRMEVETFLGGRKRGGERMGDKRDDLADSVLQGLVWLEWNKNIEVLRKALGIR